MRESTPENKEYSENKTIQSAQIQQNELMALDILEKPWDVEIIDIPFEDLGSLYDLEAFALQAQIYILSSPLKGQFISTFYHLDFKKLHLNRHNVTTNLTKIKR